MMRNILNEVTLELEEKQITAHNMLPERLTVQGNSSLLYSIFRNLTDNAIAYAGSHISVTIRCFREDERFYYFSFSDTGVGVDPEHLSRCSSVSTGWTKDVHANWAAQAWDWPL